MSLSNSRPLIGITTRHRNETDDYALAGKYVDALLGAGGLPILLTPGEDQLHPLLELVDGLVLSGGGDLDPMTYGGDDHPMVRYVCSERDQFELDLAQIAMQQSKPILGICRGMQVLSVVSGGKLFPHVPEQFGEVHHFCPVDLVPIRHDVQVSKGSRLAKMIQGETLSVVSWHHQGIQFAPPGWQAVAYAPDGLIEAIEHQQHPWAMAIQWHPEFSMDEPGHQALFAAFIEAVRQARPAPLAA
ncbi:MAG: gamma-glutamyl-gamma-aminobutyrate hydrolase family protein [Cyanobacteriota bacterium]|nr:gamma-glutamyl-gamma-aminobutyrate hydrolase family protein [Cyanobacteriota bacterium]